GRAAMGAGEAVGAAGAVEAVGAGSGPEIHLPSISHLSSIRPASQIASAITAIPATSLRRRRGLPGAFREGGRRVGACEKTGMATGSILAIEGSGAAARGMPGS